jgi:hypothetical protein
MRPDYFISYAGADRTWAEWIAWQLEEAGYNVFLQAWDLRPGTDFVHAIEQATESADRTLVVLSKAYVSSPYAQSEVTAALAQDPTGARDRLVIVRVEDVEPGGILQSRIYIDLVGQDPASATQRLLAGVRRERAKPPREPEFPGATSVPPSAPFPGDELFRFDVFICYNSADRNAAKQLAMQLKQRSVRPWFDQWEIAPGTDWQGALENQIRSIRSAAVLVGPSGFGPWQDLEKKAFLQQFLGRGAPVIPVVLADYEKEPALPPFLSMLQYVDLRESDPDPVEQLIWGITGQRPTN